MVEVKLERAPLARTLAQIRFPRLTRLVAEKEVPLRIAESLADAYPVFNEGHEMALTVTPDGISQTPAAEPLWQLVSADNSWNVSFGNSFLALHTSDYTHRGDFCERLQYVWQKFTALAPPPQIERIGFRYLNRVEDPDFIDELGAMVRAPILGGAAITTKPSLLISSLSENQFQLNENDRLHARWGILPPDAVLDPTLPAAKDRSWVLDLDSFRMYRRPSLSSGIDVVDAVQTLSKAGYRFFRWSVTERFLRRFGGDI